MYVIILIIIHTDTDSSHSKPLSHHITSHYTKHHTTH